MIDKYISDEGPSFSPEKILDIRQNPPSSFYKALLEEYGLESLAPISSDLKQVIRDAPRFVKIRGTLASMKMALSWVDVTKPTITRLSRTEYELDPGFVPSDLKLAHILTALKCSAQARARLRRVHHGSYERTFYE